MRYLTFLAVFVWQQRVIGETIFDTLIGSKPKKTIGANKPLVPLDSSELQTIDAGMVTTFTSKFFDDYTSDIMDAFLSKIQNIQLHDTRQEYSMGFTTAVFEVYNQQLQSFSIDSDASSIKISDDTAHLVATVKNITLQFNMDYQISSEPEYFKDIGKGNIMVSNFEVSLLMSPYNSNGNLLMDFKDAIISVQDYQVKLDGNSDVSKAIEICLNNFKSVFKKELANVLAWKLTKTVEDQINSQFRRDSHQIHVAESGVYVNLAITGDPKFHSDFMAVPIDGTHSIAPVKQSNKDLKRGSSENMTSLPVFLNNTSQVQLQAFVSEYTINSALQAYHQQGVTLIKQRGSSTFLKTLFPNFENVFGHHDKVLLIMQSEDDGKTFPNVSVREAGSKFESLATLKVMNPYHEAYEAIKVYLHLKGEVKFEIQEGFQLVGSVSNLTIQVTNIETSFVSRVTVKQLDTQMQSLAKPGADLINHHMQSGIEIPTQTKVKEELSKSELFIYDQFLLIQSDPNVSSRVYQRAQALTDELENYLRDLHQQSLNRNRQKQYDD